MRTRLARCSAVDVLVGINGTLNALSARTVCTWWTRIYNNQHQLIVFSFTALILIHVVITVQLMTDDCVIRTRRECRRSMSSFMLCCYDAVNADNS